MPSTEDKGFIGIAKNIREVATAILAVGAVLGALGAWGIGLMLAPIRAGVDELRKDQTEEKIKRREQDSLLVVAMLYPDRSRERRRAIRLVVGAATRELWEDSRPDPPEPVAAEPRREAAEGR